MKEGNTFAIGLVAALDEANAVLGQISQGIEHWIYGVHLSLSLSASQKSDLFDAKDNEGEFALILNKLHLVMHL